jgi:D-sedoheptulose 7-phosphate isomerase
MQIPGTKNITASIVRKAQESAHTTVEFFKHNSERLDKIASTMARSFADGGRLYVMGNGGSSCDAEHVAVEFMHPIFEKRNALPAVSLASSPAMLSAIANDSDFSRVFSLQLQKLATKNDMALFISTSGESANLVAGAKEAKSIGMLTIAFCGKDGGRLENIVDWNLIVPSYSIHRIQETHTVLLHILWDLIHLQLGEDDIV